MSKTTPNFGDLNSADWGRIEAALRSVVDEFAAIPESKRHPRALPAMQRTLDKVNRINNSGGGKS